MEGLQLFGVVDFITPNTTCNNILRILSVYTNTSNFKYKTIYPFSIVRYGITHINIVIVNYVTILSKMMKNVRYRYRYRYREI